MKASLRSPGILTNNNIANHFIPVPNLEGHWNSKTSLHFRLTPPQQDNNIRSRFIAMNHTHLNKGILPPRPLDES